MFGKNPVAKSEIDGDGKTLRVVGGTPFYTIQGEGPFSGDPAVFLRLHGCPLRCYFCDTEFSHPEDPTLDVFDIMDDILHAAPDHCKLLVITGGEPVRQNLSVLLPEMMLRGWTVQIETSGILWQDVLSDPAIHIVVSPKTPKIDVRIAHAAKAFKYVVKAGETHDDDGLPFTNTQREGAHPMKLARPWDVDYLGRPDPQAQVYLSPQDEYDENKNEANRREVATVSMRFGYRAGLQIHKFLNLP